MMLSVDIRHQMGRFSVNARFEAPDGVTALFGHSGSGKTTIVNAVAGLLRPQEGRIVAGDTVLFDSGRNIDLAPHARRIGYVFQEGRLFPHMNVARNLAYGRRHAPADEPGVDPERIVRLLGLENLMDRKPNGLSGGEKQRVALGRAILCKPRLLLMDEPLAALDEARKGEILPYLERLRDEIGLPIVYVSHSAAEVARLATTLVLVANGKTTQSGPAADLLADPDTATAFGLREAGAIVTGRIEAQEADGLTRLETPAGTMLLPRITARHGTLVRLRILAQDVTLATTKPVGISALNILPARVLAVRRGEGPGALVSLKCGEARLLARVTRRSADALGLQPGRDVYCIIKAVSVAPQSIGEAPGVD